MAFIAVNRGAHFLAYVAPELKTTELCLLAIEKNVNSIKHVPDESKSLELCFLAVSKKPLTLRYVPTELRSLQLCELAISKNALSLRYVPNELRNLDLCKLALKNNASDEVFKSIPDKYVKALWKIKIEVYGRETIYNRASYNKSIYSELKIIFSNMLDNLTEDDIKKELELKFAGINNQTEEIVVGLFNKHGCDFSLSLVNEQLKSEKICLLAVDKHFSNARFIPKNIKTQEFYQKALSVNGMVWRHIPKYIRNINLALLAIQNCSLDDVDLVKILRDMPNSVYDNQEFYHTVLSRFKKLIANVEDGYKMVYIFKNTPKKLLENKDFYNFIVSSYKASVIALPADDIRLINVVVGMPKDIWHDYDIDKIFLEKIKILIISLEDSDLRIIDIIRDIPKFYFLDINLYNITLEKYKNLLLAPAFINDKYYSRWELAINSAPKRFFTDIVFFQAALELYMKKINYAYSLVDYRSIPLELIECILSGCDKKIASLVFYNMKNENITLNICRIMIDKGFRWRDMWRNIPNHIKDESLCYEAIESGVSFNEIPEVYKTDKLRLLALENNKKNAI